MFLRYLVPEQMHLLSKIAVATVHVEMTRNKNMHYLLSMNKLSVFKNAKFPSVLHQWDSGGWLDDAKCIY